VPYAIKRYTEETARLYTVLDKELSDHSFVAGEEYSIADMAIYPWIMLHEMQKQDLAKFPNIARYIATMGLRDDVQRGMTCHADTFDWDSKLSEEELIAMITRYQAR
jgi:GST-like protein